MGVFDNHIENQDNIVLQNYHFKASPDYKKTMVLEEKFNLDRYLRGYSHRVFIPVDIVWKYYCNEGGLDEIDKLLHGSQRPTKNEFNAFFTAYNNKDVKKLIFKGQTYVDRSILHPIYSAFNEHYIEEQIRKKYNNEY